MSENLIGKHPYSLDARLICLTSRGAWTADEVRELIALLEREQQRDSRIGLLLDVGGGISIGPEARRALAERADKRGATIPVAIIGASLPIRAVLTMVIRTVRLLGGPAAPAAFLATEVEARRWIENYRPAGSGRLT